MTIKIPSFLLALPLLLAPGVFAQNQKFTIDPAASGITFTLGDVLHTVHGTFQVQNGSVDFNTHESKMSGSVVVSAASGKSGNDTRDRKMHIDVLDVPHFAEVTFMPSSYEGTLAPSGDSTIQVTGTFTLHGKPHDITVPMQVHIDGNNCTAKTHFTIPYVKWGLKDPSTFVLRVGKDVEIELTLVGRLNSAS